MLHSSIPLAPPLLSLPVGQLIHDVEPDDDDDDNDNNDVDDDYYYNNYVPGLLYFPDSQ